MIQLASKLITSSANENQWLSDWPQDFCPNIYKRYADDIFVTFNSYELLKKFVEHMSTKHPNIKFTFEHEHFSFLDVKICWENNKLTTSVYRKPIFSGGFTNFRSFIPTVYKFRLVYTLLHCCFNITSSYEKFHNEINTLKQILKLNGYPTQFIDRSIKKFLQKLYVTKAIQDTVNKKQLLIVLPFLGAQSFLVRKLLESCIRNTLPYCSLRIVFQSKTRLSSLLWFKDIIPKEIRSHLVYKFTCSCCNATYYGESERHFFVRASEHLGMTPLTGKRVRNPKKSVIFDRILLNGHDVNFEDFTILLKENNQFKLHLTESLLIKRDKPELNRNIYSYPLELIQSVKRQG